MSARAASIADLSEKEWQQQLVALARTLGWDRVYHTHDSRRSAGGFPDLVLVRDRVIFAELKREKTKPSSEQEDWLSQLAKAGAEAYLWRPSDLEEAATVLSKQWWFARPRGERWPSKPCLLVAGGVAWTPKSLWISAGKGPPIT